MSPSLVPDVCPKGYFGAACLSKCYCDNGVACDKVNGKCPQRRCAPGFAVYDDGQHCSGIRFTLLCSEVV